MKGSPNLGTRGGGGGGGGPQFTEKLGTVSTDLQKIVGGDPQFHGVPNFT